MFGVRSASVAPPRDAQANVFEVQYLRRWAGMVGRKGILGRKGRRASNGRRGKVGEMEDWSRLVLLLAHRSVGGGGGGNREEMPLLPYLPTRPNQLTPILEINDVGLGGHRWEHRCDASSKRAIE